MKKILLTTLIVAGVGAAGAAYMLQGGDTPPAPTAVATATTATAPDAQLVTIWRAPGCGCCDAWGEYMEKAGYAVKIIDDKDFDKTAISVGVPEQGLGCHLAKVGKYFVSGLVPADIIERLLEERPAITGITLPGMPANAPGMAPEKTGTLKTYAFGEGGITVYSDE